jgi:hypothetical protein
MQESRFGPESSSFQTFDVDGDRIRVGLQAGSYSIVSVGNMGFLNCILVQPDGPDSPGCTKVSWFQNDIVLMGHQTYPGHIELKCRDSNRKIWAVAVNDVPQVVRFTFVPGNGG